MKVLGIFLVISTIFMVGQCAVIETKAESLMKVFNYQGNLPPIKDDRTGEITGLPVSNSTQQAQDEAACWNLIVEQSAVTFALQNKVLNELEAELKDHTLDPKLQEAITKLTTRLRASMKDALDALNRESPEEYFDALFDTSESIVQISSLIRDPKLNEKVFLILVKAVSRLGRNNSSLVQDFIDQCSIVERRPRPRGSTSF